MPARLSLVSDDMKRELFVVLVVCIGLLAIIPRGVELISNNYLFEFDQGYYFQDVRSMVESRKPVLVGTQAGGLAGFFQGPGWYYLLLIPFFLGQGDPYAAMVMMFVLSLGSIIAAYFVAKRVFTPGTGIVALYLMAVSPSLISQARFIWAPFPVTILSVLYLYALYRVFTGSAVYVYALFFIIGSMYHFEIAASISLLGVTIVLLMVFARSIWTVRRVALSLAVLAASFAPMIVFDMRHDFLNIRGMAHLILEGGLQEVTPGSIGQRLLDRVAVFTTQFYTSFPLPERIRGFALLAHVFAAIAFLRDARVSSASRRFIACVLCIPVGLFVAFLPYSGIMWEWWTLELIPMYIITAAVFISHFSGVRVARPIVIAFIVMMSVTYTQNTWRSYMVDLPDYGGTHKIKGKVDAMDFIYASAQDERFGLQVFSPPVYTFPYDYLAWWRGFKTYGYQPHGEYLGTVYLLIEPDPHKPWSYDGWLETVVPAGTVLWRETLPSGFIIEKRVYDGNDV